jgi:hypothetical protein
MQLQIRKCYDDVTRLTPMRLLVAIIIFSLVYIPFDVEVVFAQSDTDAPDITNVKIGTVNDTSVTVTWETDEKADSLVNYGLQEDYGIVRVPTVDRTQHSITLDNLDSGRVYYFRVVSADEEGNQGISADYKVQTTGTPRAEGQGQAEAQGDGQGSQAGEGAGTPQTPTVEEIKEQIKEITDPQQLQEIMNEVVKAIQGITEDLTIVGPPTVIPETNTAVVKWTTDREASSKVLFSPSDQFTEGSYVYSQESTGGATTDHEVRLIGLEPFTEYHFKVVSADSFGIEGQSRDYTFKTKASLPEIRNLRIVKVEENAATLAWDTTVPAKALVEYQDLSTGGQNSKGRPTLATTHQMRLDDLTLGTRYVAFVIAENGGGDRVKSQPITFITVKDTAPPIISNVTNESTLFPGGESRVQSIVEWKTDEPSFCKMTYREGVAGGVEPTTIEPETVSYTDRHVEVIVDFASATVYQFWLNCSDEAGNEIQSENFVLFTPIQEKNIIDLILENFESTFGWVKNIRG